jgi:hypothetical protein
MPCYKRSVGRILLGFLFITSLAKADLTCRANFSDSVQNLTSQYVEAPKELGPLDHQRLSSRGLPVEGAKAIARGVEASLYRLADGRLVKTFSNGWSMTNALRLRELMTRHLVASGFEVVNIREINTEKLYTIEDPIHGVSIVNYFDIRKVDVAVKDRLLTQLAEALQQTNLRLRQDPTVKDVDVHRTRHIETYYRDSDILFPALEAAIEVRDGKPLHININAENILIVNDGTKVRLVVVDFR